MSKWFYKGLNNQEIILLENLLQRSPQELLPLLSEPGVLLKRGIELVFSLSCQAAKNPLYGLHLECLLGYSQELLFSEEEFLAVWKLRSVQALRDYIFQPMPSVEEHEGKTGIRRTRIRGYRDGKASPRDPRLTALSRTVDVLFHEEKYHKKWDSLFHELDGLDSLSVYIKTYFELLYRQSPG